MFMNRALIMSCELSSFRCWCLLIRLLSCEPSFYSKIFMLMFMNWAPVIWTKSYLCWSSWIGLLSRELSSCRCSWIGLLWTKLLSMPMFRYSSFVRCSTLYAKHYALPLCLFHFYNPFTIVLQTVSLCLLIRLLLCEPSSSPCWIVDVHDYGSYHVNRAHIGVGVRESSSFGSYKAWFIQVLLPSCICFFMSSWGFISLVLWKLTFGKQCYHQFLRFIMFLCQTWFQNERA